MAPTLLPSLPPEGALAADRQSRIRARPLVGPSHAGAATLGHVGELGRLGSPMTWTHKVIWTEGMFLQPQHFQQHDRYLEYQLRQRLAATIGYAWGYTAIAIDEAALALGKLSLNSAQGILPDGSAFSVPGNDAAPAALDVPADARNEPWPTCKKPCRSFSRSR